MGERQKRKVGAWLLSEHQEKVAANFMRGHPSLWYRFAPGFSDKGRKVALFERLALRLGVTEEHAQKWWKNARDTYNGLFKRRVVQMKSGDITAREKYILQLLDFLSCAEKLEELPVDASPPPRDNPGLQMPPSTAAGRDILRMRASSPVRGSVGPSKKARLETPSKDASLGSPFREVSPTPGPSTQSPNGSDLGHVASVSLAAEVETEEDARHRVLKDEDSSFEEEVTVADVWSEVKQEVDLGGSEADESAAVESAAASSVSVPAAASMQPVAPIPREMKEAYLKYVSVFLLGVSDDRFLHFQGQIDDLIRKELQQPK